ncbi:MAG: energy transducer TonB [Alistipes sp.]
MAKSNDLDNKVAGGKEKRPAAPRRQPLRLPFDGRSQDAGGWAYDHRIGLFVTIIAYLLFGIVFMGYKVATTSRSNAGSMVIDLQTLDALQAERDRLEEEVRRNNSRIDWNSIRNLSSNENALNENLRDAKGMNAAEINSSADAVENRMRSNREAYERGLAEADAIRHNGKRNDGNSDEESDRKMQGSVTVSFSLVNPVRYSRRLDKPAYRCEGGGEVVVDIVVNQRGEVVSAQVASGGDECMRTIAVASARNSLFDHNDNAPARQSGTITYIFIPQ